MCEYGTEVQMPVRVLPSKEIKVKGVDACLAPLVKFLNDNGVQTWGSCCGHGKNRGSISIDESSIRRVLELGFSVSPEEHGDGMGYEIPL